MIQLSLRLPLLPMRSLPYPPRRSVMLLASGTSYSYGRTVPLHLNGDSSSEASSDFHSDASSDSSSRHSLPDHSSPDLPGTSAGLSRKRRRSPMTSVPALSPVSGALSPVRADLIPSPKRVRDSGYLTDVEVDHRETSLRDDAIVRVSDEPHLEQDSDPEIQAEIDECFAYADALRDRGIDARVVVETIDRDETETGVRGPVEVRVERVTHPVMPEDIPEPAQEGSVEVTYETLGDLVQRFHDHTQAIPDHRIQAIEGVQREQGHRIDGVDQQFLFGFERGLQSWRVITGGLEAHEVLRSRRVDRLIRCMSRMQEKKWKWRNEEMERQGKTEMEIMVMNLEFQASGQSALSKLLEVQPHNFSGTEALSDLTAAGFEKMETDSALTWWNSHKRTIGVKAAYAMNWVELMKLMTEVYCPRNEIQKMETELWNLTVKGNDLTAYTQKIRKWKGFIGSLPTTFKGKCECCESNQTPGSIRIAYQFKDKKSRVMQQGWAELARSLYAGNNERKGYAGPLPYCNKCRLHHEGLCTLRCGNCKKAGHQTRDCRAVIAPNTQRAPNRGTNPKTRMETRTETRLEVQTTARAYAIGRRKNTIPMCVTDALLDVTPTTLETSYAVELADGRISETNICA
ncbi:putative reverse transcriptase domain-containing protein [Tanacetum coccineum]